MSLLLVSYDEVLILMTVSPTVPYKVILLRGEATENGRRTKFR